MISSAALLSLLLTCPPDPGDDLGQGHERVYRVRQTTFLHEVPEDAGLVRWWVSIPDDERFQDVLDFQVVSAPGEWRIERDVDRGNRFLFIEARSPAAETLEAVVEFTLRREAVFVDVDPARVGPITPALGRLFAEEVRPDAPHMVTSEEVIARAEEVCGEETNPALQARRLLDYVADEADHYSKNPELPSCGIGDAENCLTNGGGCCTDLHSLFIALARSRGIPSRLQMGYRLLPKNEGKEVDPGYRCWAEYFLPGYGWIPADIVEADAEEGLGRGRWFSGLTEHRLWLNSGREFQLSPAQAGGRVNTMAQGYAEIDGTPARVLPAGELASQFSRRVRFSELDGMER